MTPSSSSSSSSTQTQPQPPRRQLFWIIKTTSPLLLLLSFLTTTMVLTRSGAAAAACLVSKGGRVAVTSASSTVNKVPATVVASSASTSNNNSRMSKMVEEEEPKKKRRLNKNNLTTIKGQGVVSGDKTSPLSSISITSNSERKNNDNDGDNKQNKNKNLLLTLPDDAVIGELICRPSKRNRSPYVADVYLPHEKREVIVHVPNLDMGGKCVAGSTILLKPARDKKGNLVGRNAVNPKYNTPKCEYIAQLLRVDETSLGYDGPTWVGAHPSLGEKIAEQLIKRNLLQPHLPTVKSYKREVKLTTTNNMRADFVIEYDDPTIPHGILEVKTVVDTDYSINAIPSSSSSKLKCVFTNDEIPYKRTAIFPWGNSNQKGPNGEKVVSARAIKHVQELTKLQVVSNNNDDDDEKKQKYDTTILFIVIRGDAKAFRPNHEACPSFARYLKEAKDAGVRILAKQVCWGGGGGGEDNNNNDGDDIGNCYEGKLLDIKWP